MSTDAQMNQRYTLNKILGKGGMGVVYHATDRLTGDTVALKRVTVAPRDLAFASHISDNQDSTALRFALAQEFRTLATLRHPNIVSVLDYGFDSAKQPFFTMTLLENAQDIIEYGQSLSLDQKIQLLIQTLQALKYLHRRDILHRDLKPVNVQVVEDGGVKVLDFGLSVTVNQNSGVAGTLSYMAPEVLINQTTLKVSDLYSVGVIAYELLLGKYPFSLRNATRLMRSIVEELPDTSELENLQLAAVLERWLHKDPDARYQTADDVIIALSTATETPYPQETIAIRESFLNASSFVGRTDELKILDDELQKTKLGQNTFYLIGGESGIGKSRLVDELHVKAVVNGIKVYTGQGVEGGGMLLQIWRPIVAQMLFDVEVSPQEAGIIKPLVPNIEQMLGLQAVSPPELHGNQQERLFMTLIELFKRITSPTLVILEDLQWTAESFALLKQIMLNRAQLSHVMIVGTYRSDESPTLSDELKGFNHIELSRLNRDMIASLSRAMLGETEREKQFIDLLEKQTEGNTFFMIEVVRYLAQLAGNMRDIAHITLPANVLTGGMQYVLQKRLGQISSKYQPVLQFSAVVGRKIDNILLQAMFPDTYINDWLFEAEAVSVLSVQDNKWQFAHDKLREAVIKDLSPDDFTRLNREVALTIEEVYPDNSDYNEMLLEHWHQAQNLDKEIHYLSLVAKSLIDIRADYERAIFLLEPALQQLDMSDKRRIELLYWLAVAHQNQGQLEQGYTHISQAYDLAKNLDDKRGIALILKNFCALEYYTGDREVATQYAHESLALFKELGDHYEVAAMLGKIGIVHAVEGRYNEARKFYEESLQIRREIDDKHGIAIIHNNLGMLGYYEKRYDEALAYFAHCLELYREIGEQLYTGISLSNVAWIYAITNDDRLFEATYQALLQSLKISVPYLTLAILPTVAKLFVTQGEAFRSAQLIAFIEQHPSFHGEIKERVDRIKPQLETMLTTQERLDAYHFENLPEMDTLVGSIVDELGSGANEEESHIDGKQQQFGS